jgi:hypothetical protein
MVHRADLPKMSRRIWTSTLSHTHCRGRYLTLLLKPGRSAETKKEDLNANDIDAAAKIIAGTARSMGITVV